MTLPQKEIVIILGNSLSGKDTFAANEFPQHANIKFSLVAKRWLNQVTGVDMEDKEARSEDFAGYPFSALDVLKGLFHLKLANPGFRDKLINHTLSEVPEDTDLVFTDVRTVTELRAVMFLAKAEECNLKIFHVEGGKMLDTDTEIVIILDYLEWQGYTVTKLHRAE